MSRFLARLFGAKPPAPVALPRPTTDIAKIDFHIRRFTLALEQCEKGPERRDELQRNLNFWLRMKDAEQARQGAL